MVLGLLIQLPTHAQDKSIQRLIRSWLCQRLTKGNLGGADPPLRSLCHTWGQKRTQCPSRLLPIKMPWSYWVTRSRRGGVPDLKKNFLASKWQSRNWWRYDSGDADSIVGCFSGSTEWSCDAHGDERLGGTSGSRDDRRNVRLILDALKASNPKLPIVLCTVYSQFRVQEAAR